MEKALFGMEAGATRAASFEVDSAYQGREGLEGRPYAMALIDVRARPGWDGVEITARIWEIDPDVQVVICTAHSDYSWSKMIDQLFPPGGSPQRLRPQGTLKVSRFP